MAPNKQSGLQTVDGRAMILADGQPLTVMYSETHPRNMHKHNQQMAKAGVQVFMITVRGDRHGDFWSTHFWSGRNDFGDESTRDDGLELNRQVAEIQAVNPDAWFMVRWSGAVPQRWAKEHPDHLQQSTDTKLDRASYASRLAAEGRAEMTRRIVSYCEAQPWGKRVVGYIPFGQDEGTHELALFHSLFDQAPVMQKEFGRFLATRYDTDEKLQAAWNDPDAALDAARVPTTAEWEADCARWKHWPEPSELRRYQDYFLLLRELQAMQRRAELDAVRETVKRPVVTATDAYKEPMLGWLHNDAFHGKSIGMDYRNPLLASGCFDAGDILDTPSLDALITPADYTARSNGFGWDSEGIGDSLVLRGKTLFIEDDARSWATEERKTQGAWRTPAECRAGLLRNLAIGASRGLFPYWMNVGGGYFDDPQVLDIVKDQVPVRKKLLTRPLERTEHAIAMIIDDTSPMDEDFTSGYQNLAVLRQRNDHLSNTGIPWRIFLLSDLERDDFPVYRCYILPNAFRLTPEKLALIRRKLMRRGSVVILGPGTGISDGKELTAEPLSQLFGAEFVLQDVESARRVLAYGGGHPALRDMRGPVTFGDSYSYGPMLTPPLNLDGTGLVELGKPSTWWYNNTAGLVMKEFGAGAAGNGNDGDRDAGDCALVFSMAVPMPAALLRSLAIYGGCNPWSDYGDVVAANGNMVAVHSIRPGKRTILLPNAATVVDAVTGDSIAENVNEFSIELESPDTKVFLLNR